LSKGVILDEAPITDDEGQTQLTLRPTQAGDVSILVVVSKEGHRSMTKNVFLTVESSEQLFEGQLISPIIIVPIVITAFSIGLVIIVKRKRAVRVG